MSAQKRDYHSFSAVLSSTFANFLHRRHLSSASALSMQARSLTTQLPRASSSFAAALTSRKNQSPCSAGALERISSLTMSYFHTGIRTIIGAESFHCPVQDGKEWDQLAMVIRLKPFTARGLGPGAAHSQSRIRILIALSQRARLACKRTPIGSRGWRSCTASQS